MSLAERGREDAHGLITNTAKFAVSIGLWKQVPFIGQKAPELTVEERRHFERAKRYLRYEQFLLENNGWQRYPPKREVRGSV